MAVGSSGVNTKRLYRTGIADAFSFSGGFSFGVHFRHPASGVYGTFLSFAPSPTGTAELNHAIDETGQLVSWHAGGMVNYGTIATNTWHFVGMSISGTSGTRYNGNSGAALTSAARTMTSFTIGQLAVLVNAHFDTEPYNGQVAGFWVAPRAVSVDEMTAASRTMLGPKDAWLAWPMLDVATAALDYSGNGRVPTLGSVALDSVTSDPPISWGRAGRRRLWFVPAAAGGTTVSPAHLESTAQAHAPRVDLGLAPTAVGPSSTANSPAVALQVQPTAVGPDAKAHAPAAALQLSPTRAGPESAATSPRVDLRLEPAGVGPDSRAYSPSVGENPSQTVSLAAVGPQSAAFSPRADLGLALVAAGSSSTANAPQAGLQVAVGAVPSGARAYSPSLSDIPSQTVSISSVLGSAAAAHSPSVTVQENVLNKRPGITLAVSTMQLRTLPVSPQHLRTEDVNG